MKKLIIALIGCLFTSLVHSQTVVEIVWPFSIASPPANYLRQIIEQANSTQAEFKFVLIQRVGAGGSIAANAVKNSNRPALLASTTAFFVRPYLYPEQSYKFSNFVPVLLMGSGPIGFIGNGKSDWNSILSKKQIFIGTNGVGSLSHVVADNLKQLYPQVILVPYQGPTEAAKGVIAGDIDLVIDVPSQARPDQTLLKLHNITGSNSYNGKFVLLSKEVDTKFVNMSVDFFIVAPTDMDPLEIKKLSVILTSANVNNRKLADLYQSEYVIVNQNISDAWYTEKVMQWKEITKNVKADY